MLLAVDIGNSTISIGLFDSKGILQFLSSLDTDPQQNGRSDLRGFDESISIIPFPL